MIAFFPACLPARRMTTLPGFILKIYGYALMLMGVSYHRDLGQIGHLGKSQTDSTVEKKKVVETYIFPIV